MSKAVMISIRPKWCALIANGEKTVEVRKTRPKLDTPFKCYIYCTQGDWLTSVNGVVQKVNECEINLRSASTVRDLNGMVIGEFVLDEIHDINYLIENGTGYSGFETNYPYGADCLTVDELEEYLLKEKWLINGMDLVGYGWHISALQIYDEPKELKAFRLWNRPQCAYGDLGYATLKSCDGCNNPPCYVQRAFQSWGYVEELQCH